MGKDELTLGEFYEEGHIGLGGPGETLRRCRGTGSSPCPYEQMLCDERHCPW